MTTLIFSIQRSSREKKKKKVSPYDWNGMSLSNAHKLTYREPIFLAVPKFWIQSSNMDVR